MNKLTEKNDVRLDVSFNTCSAGAQMLAVLLNGLQGDLDVGFVGDFVKPYLACVPIKASTLLSYQAGFKQANPDQIMKNVARIISVEPTALGNHTRDDSTL